LLSLAIIGLYLWLTYGGESTSDQSTVSISIIAAALAGVTALTCIVTYFKPPKSKLFIVDLFVYLLLISNTATLILTTGQTNSPFIALWGLLSLFSAIFGASGLIIILAATGVLAGNLFISNQFDNATIITLTIASVLPALASLLIWRAKSAKEELMNDSRDMKSLANELNEVASKSEVVINAIGDGVVAIDGQGVIQLINPAAQVIIGWVKQDAISLNYKSVLQLVDAKNDALDPATNPIQQALNLNQQIRTSSLGLMTKSGKKITISLVVSPVSDTGSGVIAVFHDVTKEKAEEREQAEFISTASHEMRTPVASIEGYLGLVLNPQTAQIDLRARGFIEKAQAATQHLGRLFQDLLDVSKADDGRIKNSPKVIDMVAFVGEIVQGLEQKAVSKGLRLVYKPMPEGDREKHIAPVYYCNLDNDHVREIVNNLVENAIKYTMSGEIVVDITGDNDRVVISVKDSGIGIPVEDMPHLFQKFYRVENKDTREISGTGLGLYLCRRLAEVMGGRIWAESVYTTGSTFYVELPRISSQEATQLMESEAIKARQESERTEQLLANQQRQNIISTEVKNNAPQQVQAPSFAQSRQQPIPANRTMQPTRQAPPITSPAVAPQAPTPVPQAATAPLPAAPTPVRAAAPVSHAVPRSQSLTPEQIAAYVAKQRALASQQTAPQLTVNHGPQPAPASRNP
jgi:PAS domain S-box-containing protein